MMVRFLVNIYNTQYPPVPAKLRLVGYLTFKLYLNPSQFTSGNYLESITHPTLSTTERVKFRGVLCSPDCKRQGL